LSGNNVPEKVGGRPQNKKTDHVDERRSYYLRKKEEQERKNGHGLRWREKEKKQRRRKANPFFEAKLR